MSDFTTYIYPPDIVEITLTAPVTFEPLDFSGAPLPAHPGDVVRTSRLALNLSLPALYVWPAQEGTNPAHLAWVPSSALKT